MEMGKFNTAKAHWKCVSFDVLPCIALWWAWRCESLRIVRVEGEKAAVNWNNTEREMSQRLKHTLIDMSFNKENGSITFSRIVSSTGVLLLAADILSRVDVENKRRAIRWPVDRPVEASIE